MNTADDYVFPNLRSGIQLIDVEVYDNETSGAVVLETGGDTLLVPDALDPTDDYLIRLTRQPDETVTVAVLTDGLADVTSIEDGDGGVVLITPERILGVG